MLVGLQENCGIIIQSENVVEEEFMFQICNVEEFFIVELKAQKETVP